jgi:hypothetical protein
MTKDNLPIPLPEQNNALSLRRTNQLIEVTDKILARSREEIAVQATTPTTSNPIIRLTTEGLLHQAQQTQLQQARFRIGDYELREPDYRQICLWAEELRIAPDELLGVLADSRLEPKTGSFEPIVFSLVDGALHSLVWDFSRLPMAPDRWDRSLLLDTLGFTASPAYDAEDFSLAPEAPRLRRLHCDFSRFAWPGGHFPLCGLKLDGVPHLSELTCYHTLLTDLDLSPVPGLTELDFYWNSLIKLDLWPVPGLTVLRCSHNRITKLDLSPVPGLVKLECSHIGITKLDLTPVPGLTTLDCGQNRLSELDLSPVPGLTELDCCSGYGALTKLDLTPVPGLTVLHCSDNKLTELDLSPVLGLTSLNCDKDVIVRNAPPNLKILRKRSLDDV